MASNVGFTVLQDIMYVVILLVGGYFFGRAFFRIYNGKLVFSTKEYGYVESKIYKLMGIDPTEEMTAKKYAQGIIAFSVFGLVFFIAVVMLQAYLSLNPEEIDGMSWHLAFNTAASFVTNTNWQSYSGESSLSYLSQMICLTTQNFVSGSVGIAVLFALMRGFTRKESKTIGNLWVDITKITLFMIPVSFVGAIILVSEGVPQTMSGAVSYVSLNGTASEIYLGPAASQIIIKQLFTNGGGFYGVNSAFPLENPTPLSNLIECESLLWIPCGLCFTFGKVVSEKRKNGTVAVRKNQGITLLSAMTIIFVACLIICTVAEYNGAISMSGVSSIGNIEGKETRFGIGGSSLWAVATTSASNGSVNAMHDSFTAIGGFVPMFLMMLGEIVYGGVGCGLYGMVAFALLTVFIAGLMVGRTPEYLGKKVASFDMKMVCLVILTPVLSLLITTAATVMLPEVQSWLNNGGPHGFSEILYVFTSMANNNGSAFAGYFADTPWTNVVGGLSMLLVRFIPMIAVVYLSGNLAKKKIVPVTDGTLQTNNLMFVFLLIMIILIIGALSFFPALALGPFAEALM